MSRSSRVLVALALVVSVPAVVAAQAAAVPKTVVNTRRPNPNLSGGIRVGDMLYASGTLGPADSTIESRPA